MAKTMKELLAEKKAKEAGAPAVPAKKPVAKAAPVAEVEEETEEETEGEESGEEAGEEETEGEEGGEESGEEGEEGGEEEEAAPVVPAKKPVAGKPVAKAAPAKLIAKPAAKPLPTKAVAKPLAAVKAVAKPAAAAPAAVKKSAGWGKKDSAKEAPELKPGAWMPQDRFIDLLHSRLDALGMAPATKAMTTAVFKEIEAAMLDVLQVNDLKFLGVKFRRVAMGSRVYAPNPGLEKVATPYHTLVSPHTKVSLSLYFDKAVERGQLNDDGEFESGQFDEDGTFVPGTWENDEFTPAAPPVKKMAGTKKK